MRKLLRKPHFWLAIVLVGLVGAGLDSCREPPDQITGRLYVRLVRGYQYVSRPCLGNYIQCRYRPSCSEYSMEAVRRYGIRKGLWLTVSRLCRCTGSVPPGTDDPVAEVP